MQDKYSVDYLKLISSALRSKMYLEYIINISCVVLTLFTD
jgi:hypothetical protein